MLVKAKLTVSFWSLAIVIVAEVPVLDKVGTLENVNVALVKLSRNTNAKTLAIAKFNVLVFILL